MNGGHFQDKARGHGRNIHEAAGQPTFGELRERLSWTLNNYRMKNDLGDLPEPWPRATVEAVNWFLGVICEPESLREKPIRVAKRGGEGSRWDWQYEVRVRALLAQFLNMDQASQMAIAAGCEAGYPWRGEPVEHYRMIARESLEMKKVGREEYVKKTAAEAGKLSDRQQVDPNR